MNEPDILDVEITNLDGQRSTLPRGLLARSLRWKSVKRGMVPLTILLFILFIRQVFPAGLPFPSTTPTAQRILSSSSQERVTIHGLTFISTWGSLTARHFTRSILWRIPTHGYYASVLAVSGGEVFVKMHRGTQSFGELVVLRESDGSVLWRRICRVHATLAIEGGTLFLNSWSLQAMRVSDGVMLWQYKTTHGLLEDAPMLHTGTITVQTRDGVVIALSANNGTIVSPPKQVKRGVGSHSHVQ